MNLKEEKQYVPQMWQDQNGNLYNSSFMETYYENEDPDYIASMAYIHDDIRIVCSWRIKSLKNHTAK